MENFHYITAYLLILLSVALSRLEGLNLEREIILSSLRTLIQLVALGYLLHYLLRLSQLWEFFVVFSLMGLVASLIFVERARSFSLLPAAFVAITASYGTPVVLLLLSGILRGLPHEVIPFGGLIIGNTLNSLSLFYDRLTAEIRNRKEEIEARVALGATLRQALSEPIRDSIRASLIPKINWLKSAGLVHIPGVAVGMLVAGASPFKAILFQVVILYTLLFSGLVGSILFTYTAYERIFRASFRGSGR
ncbi:MAG: iron export ABC transporter permease subunit FetB [Aquificae bacterium]|nr:iron export ABC transporter permease subunit FetB [Aquificota bacterium]